MTHPVLNKLDLEVIARVKAGVRFKPEPVKRKAREPRQSFTYRRNWRNILRSNHA